MFLKITASDPAAILNWGLSGGMKQHRSYLFDRGIDCTPFVSPRTFGKRYFWIERCIPKLRLYTIPLAVLAFGDEAALPMALICRYNCAITLTAFFVSGNGSGPVAAVKRRSFTMITNPLVIAVLAGLLFSASGFIMPKIPQQFGTLLAGAAAPVCARSWCNLVWTTRSGRSR